MKNVSEGAKLEVKASVAGRNGLFILLLSRLVLFAFFQFLISFFINSWSASVAYWMLTATLTNIVSIVLLIVLFRKEGGKFLSLFRIRKLKWKNDLILVTGLALISILLIWLPPYFVQKWIWGDSNYPQELLFQPLSKNLSLVLLIVFPLTIGFAELATYFGYIMPHLKKYYSSNYVVVLLPVFFLSLQHCTLPLIFDSQFILYRGLSFLPFALLIGIVLFKRPYLLPYFAILHVALDASAAFMLLSQSTIN
jgi:hypothetical protein